MKRSHLALFALSILLSGSLLLGLGGDLLAQPFGGHHGGGPGRGFFSSLTDEQREAVQELITEIREQGASREEIHEAVSELLAEWGIEMPERRGGRGKPGGFRHGRQDFMEDLTNQQRAAIRGRTLELWQDGATGREIHAAVDELLKGYGVELPEHRGGGPGRGGFGRFRGGFWADLTEEQRETIRMTITEMRSQGANRGEIHTAVAELLEEYGIEPPDFSADLTQEQRAAVRARIMELWKDGATRQEIRAAAAELLKGYDVELPEHWRGCRIPGGFGLRRDGFLSQLNDEQRRTVRKTVRAMRRQRATRKEIRAAVDEKLEEYGVQLPDFSADLTKEQRAAVRATAMKLWKKGATHEEIRAAVIELLPSFGIEWPEESENTSSEASPAEVPILTQSYPNPANPEANIAYTLSVSEKVRIQIFNISGQLVHTFDMGYQSPGSYSVQWDGRHENGQPVASGVYFYRIQAGPHAVTNRLVLLK